MQNSQNQDFNLLENVHDFFKHFFHPESLMGELDIIQEAILSVWHYFTSILFYQEDLKGDFEEQFDPENDGIWTI